MSTSHPRLVRVGRAAIQHGRFLLQRAVEHARNWALEYVELDLQYAVQCERAAVCATRRKRRSLSVVRRAYKR